MDHPVIFGACSAVALWAAARVGTVVHKRSGPTTEDTQKDLGFVVGAILTLLGLLIGFSFSMAISRYDQRKNYEEEEANAIGTEYLRAGLLPAASGAKTRQVLVKYVDQRTQWYETHDEEKLAAINAEVARLQNEMWAEVKGAAAAEPTCVAAVAVTGMNDVLNTQGYTQAAWWNRIPIMAWILMMLIALFSSFLIGYSSHQFSGPVFWIVPIAVSISFMLIADIDSPRTGLIRVVPQNLVSLAQSMQQQ